MTGFLVRRLAAAAASPLGVPLLVTLFLNLIPGDPIEVMLGEQPGGEVGSRELRRRPNEPQSVRQLHSTKHTDGLPGTPTGSAARRSIDGDLMTVPDRSPCLVI